jgi:hypothetical protein
LIDFFPVDLYVYYYFHSDEMDKTIKNLMNRGVDLKPKFKRYRHTEIIAIGDGVVLGKYENIVFLILKDDIPCDCLKKVIVEITTADETFAEFKFGKFKVENEEKIKIDAEFSEELFYDLIPALHIELLKVRSLLKECNLQAEALSKEETEIIREISKLSEVAKKSSEVLELEEIVTEVSTHHTDFFRKFMHFKDINEELFSAITRFEVISKELDMFFEKFLEFKESVERLKYFESKFEQTLNGIRDMFSLISLRLDMLRNREYLELQKRTSSLQAATAVIEFVAVFYYTLKIWDHFMPIESLPNSISFLILTLFTALVVIYTDVLGEIIRERKVSWKFVATTFLLVFVVLLMVLAPNLFSEA